MMQKAFKGRKIVIYADHRELNSRVASILRKHCQLRKQLEVAEILYI